MWGPNHKHKLNDCIETKVWLLQTPGYSSRTCTLQHSPDSSVYWRLGVGTNPCCSVAQSCLILWNSMDCSTLGFHVLRHLPEFAQTHVHWAGDDIQPSHLLPSPLALNLSKHQSLFQSWLFASGGQSIEASASASVLPMNIQSWFPLGLTSLISLLFNGLPRVFSTTSL